MLEQIEILLEGRNPYADAAITGRLADAVRAALRDGEALTAFVRGRIVGAGAGLWVLTDRRLLAFDPAGRVPVRDLGVEGVEALDVEAGRYGSTVGLTLRGRRAALFACHPGLASSFARALVAQRPHLSTDAAPLSAEEAVEVGRVLAQSRLAVAPPLGDAARGTLVLLKEAADLHARGALDGAEFARLKHRLLEAA